MLLAFRHFPLEGTHPLALPAAVASECAGKQQRFWEAHDWLFGLNGNPPSEVTQLTALPTSLGLDAPSFTACMNTPDVTAQVRRDMQAAKSLEVAGTPAFFIGLRRPDGTVQLLKRINGAQPVSAFDSSIREALAKAGI